jgi:hypothetical protein
MIAFDADIKNKSTSVRYFDFAQYRLPRLILLLWKRNFETSVAKPTPRLHISPSPKK